MVFTPTNVTIRFKYKGIMNVDNIILVNYPTNLNLSMAFHDKPKQFACSSIIDATASASAKCMLDMDQKQISISRLVQSQ